MEDINQRISIDIVGLAGACSYALDCIESELVNIRSRHGKRVAYLSACMAEYFGLSEDETQDLVICALLHDNALTQYISEELQKNHSTDIRKAVPIATRSTHCIYGEENISRLPFMTDVKNAILFHHENADGTGPFRKTWTEVPLYARIIHLADVVDVAGKSRLSREDAWEWVSHWIKEYEGRLFDSECVSAFLQSVSEDSVLPLRTGDFEKELWQMVPRKKVSLDWQSLKNIADFYARIVDYKSPFTSTHSMGVAEKAAELARYKGYDQLDVEKMYLAGALHDIGKMAIGNDILEKPDVLTDVEFKKMQNHAAYTYMILSEVDDFEDIRDWAAFHHEKLNGKGYPFGKTAQELNDPERAMACIDIYQALTEKRPYKDGFSHEKTCDILDSMAQKGYVDADIAYQIRDCFGSTSSKQVN